MPRPDMKVHTVTLFPGSSEYQDVMRKFQATATGENIQKIERVQNPYLYQSYMLRKKEMDKENRGNNERQLFHGTDTKNISNINTQGFKRSLSGVNGEYFRNYNDHKMCPRFSHDVPYCMKFWRHFNSAILKNLYLAAL